MNDNVTVRFANEGELGSLLELWTAVFEAPASVFTCEYESFRPENRVTIVGESNGRIVSSVQLFGIPIRDEALSPATIGGLANVSTLPKFRGQGIAMRLLKRAIGEMREREYAFSMLLTQRHSFYEQMGWRTIHRSFVEVLVRGSNRVDATSPVARQQDPDLNRLRDLSDSSFRTPLSRIRGDLDWKYRIPVRLESKTVFMSESAYAIVREAEGCAVLEEWGMASPSVEDFQNILVAVSKWADSKEISSLVISAPILSEARQALESQFMRIRNVEETEAMIRPLNDTWTMARLISLFSLPEARFFRMDNF